MTTSRCPAAEPITRPCCPAPPWPGRLNTSLPGSWPRAVLEGSAARAGAGGHNVEGMTLKLGHRAPGLWSRPPIVDSPTVSKVFLFISCGRACSLRAYSLPPQLMTPALAADLNPRSRGLNSSPPSGAPRSCRPRLRRRPASCSAANVPVRTNRFLKKGLPEGPTAKVQIMPSASEGERTGAPYALSSPGPPAHSVQLYNSLGSSPSTHASST
mmetsp:Transcript_26490/g.57800  ORF Transcript_26490/g.57800 Transcript_26490/m.57800 type:complete len:213 (+) Transcript_26490:1494-2132(+)